MNDLERIDEIYRKFYADDYGLPSLDHTIGNGVIERSGEIIAFGMVRLFPEAIIVTDQDAVLRDRVGAIKLLLEEAGKCCSARKYEELVAKTLDSKFYSFLLNLGFRPLPGESLIIEVKDGQLKSKTDK